MQSQENDTQQKNTLLLVGSLGDKQGLAYVLNALLLLKNTGLRIKLLCVGPVNEAVETILISSESYNEVKDQVTFAGFKKFPDAYKNIENCFAGLALPEDMKNKKESYPTKLFEYMAVGLPVICSDAEKNQEVIDECGCGICVDPFSTEEIADAISYLNRAAYQAKKMGMAGRKAVEENYNWRTKEAELLKLYKNLFS